MEWPAVFGDETLIFEYPTLIGYDFISALWMLTLRFSSTFREIVKVIDASTDLATFERFDAGTLSAGDFPHLV